MRGYLIPRKSGVHRAACFWLFRALLRQVKQLPLAGQQQITIGNQFRAVIKRNKQLQSPQEITKAIQLGHEALHALRSPTAWRVILTRVLELGGQRIAQQRQDDLKAISDPKASNTTPSDATSGRPRVWPHPDASKMLDRPYHDLSGRRQVPKLVNANRVPFLRVKKPQSPYVSRIIRNTVKTREKRIALSARLAEQIPIAQTEDKWDDIIFKVFGLEEVTGSAWSHELHQAIHENQNLQTSAIQKRADLSARMHSIVEQEKMLAAEEEQLMKKEKYQRIKDRRLARKENPTPVVEQERLLDSAEAAPDKLKPDMAVHDKDHYKTREEIEQMGAENEHSRTDEEVADIKSARVRRREERLKQKSEKAKRQAENVLFWRNKLGT